MNKNLIKILSTLGLIVAIALILKGVFGIGGVSVNKIKKNITKTTKTKLPTLECTIRFGDESRKITFNLQRIKDSRPKDIPSDLMERGRYFSKDPLFLELFSESEQDNQYIISVVNNKNGKDKGYLVEINRTIGDLELIVPPEAPIGLSLTENIERMGKAKRYYGSCFK